MTIKEFIIYALIFAVGFNIGRALAWIIKKIAHFIKVRFLRIKRKINGWYHSRFLVYYHKRKYDGNVRCCKNCQHYISSSYWMWGGCGASSEDILNDGRNIYLPRPNCNKFENK